MSIPSERCFDWLNLVSPSIQYVYSLCFPECSQSLDVHVKNSQNLQKWHRHRNLRKLTFSQLIHFCELIDPLWLGDATWCWRLWTSLVQIMDCCLTAPSHYLNQRWLIINGASWHSPDNNLQEALVTSINRISFKIILLKSHPYLSGANELKSLGHLITDSHRLCVQTSGQSHCQHLTLSLLTHWGRVTHICVGKITIIDSDNGLSPGRRQAIIWTNAGILLIGPLGTNFNEILIGIQTFSFKTRHLKMLSAKWRPFCLGLNVLNVVYVE